MYIQLEVTGSNVSALLTFHGLTNILHEIWSVDSQANCCHHKSHFRLKCTKFDFDWGSVPDPAGDITALHIPLNLGSLLLRGERGREGRGGARRRGGEVRIRHCMSPNVVDRDRRHCTDALCR